MKILFLMLLSLPALATIDGPLRLKGRVVGLNKNTVTIMTSGGATHEILRSSIKNGSKVRAGDDVVSEIPVSEAMRSLKEAKTKTKTKL